MIFIMGNDIITYNFKVIDDNFMVAEREFKKLSKILARNSRKLFIFGAISTGIFLYFGQNLRKKQSEIDEMKEQIEGLKLAKNAIRQN